MVCKNEMYSRWNCAACVFASLLLFVDDNSNVFCLFVCSLGVVVDDDDDNVDFCLFVLLHVYFEHSVMLSNCRKRCT